MADGQLQADLSGVMFDHCRALLGNPPPASCTVVAGPALADVTEYLRSTMGCVVVQVPEAVLTNRAAWAIVSDNGKIWSDGNV